jgi:hypothetical protein
LERFKNMVEAFEEAKTRKEPFVKRMVARSFMRLTCATQFFAACVAVGFQSVTEHMRDITKSIFMIGQTKLVEDAWQRMKVVERRDNDNTRMSSVKKWLVPVQTQVASSVHQYPEVAAADMPTMSGEATRLPGGLFKPLRRKTTVDMKGIVSSAKPSWQTFSPQSSLIQHSDMAAMLHYRSTGEWQKASLAWLSLCMKPGFVVRKPGQPWVLSLGNVRGVGTLAWPLDEVSDTTRTFFVPQAGGSLHWLIVDDVFGWECQRTAWRSPLHMAASTTSKPSVAEQGFSVRQALAESIGEPMKLIEACAWDCFFDLSVTSLRQLAKHLSIDLPAGATLFNILRLMINGCIEVSEEELCRIFSKRRMAMEKWDYISILKLDGVMEVFDSHDQKEFEKEIQVAEQEMSLGEEFHDEVKKLTRAVREKVRGGEAKQKKRKTSKSGAASSSSGQRSCPAPPQGDDLSLNDAGSLMPADCGLSKDLPNGRWLAKSKWGYSCSKSWNMYGSTKAFSMVCVAAWGWVDGECPHDWVVALASS